MLLITVIMVSLELPSITHYLYCHTELKKNQSKNMRRSYTSMAWPSLWCKEAKYCQFKSGFVFETSLDITAIKWNQMWSLLRTKEYVSQTFQKTFNFMDPAYNNSFQNLGTSENMCCYAKLNQFFWVVIDVLLLNMTEASLHQIMNCRRNVRLFQFF